MKDRFVSGFAGLAFGAGTILGVTTHEQPVFAQSQAIVEPFLLNKQPNLPPNIIFVQQLQNTRNAEQVLAETEYATWFQEKVAAFTWQDFEDPAKQQEFLSIAIDAYQFVTPSKNFTQEQMLERTFLAQTQEEFVSTINTKFSPETNDYTYNNIGRADPINRFVVLNMEKISQTHDHDKFEAGYTFLSVWGHEQGHADVTHRNLTGLIDNSAIGLGQDIALLGTGALIKIEDGGFHNQRFDEVMVDTIKVMRWEALGLHDMGRYVYYQDNGVLYLLPFTRAHMSAQELYRLHANSLVDQMPEAFGQYLSGDEPAHRRGQAMIDAFNKGDEAALLRCGILPQLQPTRNY